MPSSIKTWFPDVFCPTMLTFVASQPMGNSKPLAAGIGLNQYLPGPLSAGRIHRRKVDPQNAQPGCSPTIILVASLVPTQATKRFHGGVKSSLAAPWDCFALF